MDQSTWNLLFGWTGERCFIPEGCPPPLEGVLFYVTLAAFLTVVYIYWSDIEVLDRG